MDKYGHMSFWRNIAFTTRKHKSETKRKFLAGFTALFIGFLLYNIQQRNRQRALIDTLEKEAEKIPLNPFQTCSNYISCTF